MGSFRSAQIRLLLLLIGIVLIRTHSSAQVDASTLDQKLMMGYQGWFATPGDGSKVNRWFHWFRRQNPIATNLTVDFWPDVSEHDEDELFATGMKMADGSPAPVFSSFNEKTVVRHFRWMKEYGIDGAFLQRFASELRDPAMFEFRNAVTSHVRKGAEEHGRVFAIMYDISGQRTNDLVRTLTNDWIHLSETMGLTKSSQYSRHRGKPVVAIWGFGFSGRKDTPEQAREVIDFFKKRNVTIMGGVPTYWSTLKNDAQTNAGWAEVFRSFDIISPWSVGRYKDVRGVDDFRDRLIKPDIAEAKKANADYMPVVFPGFSWHNLDRSFAPNSIPRMGGEFYWRQIHNSIEAGSTMIYNAMFDEVDEGTAMFKVVARKESLPVESALVALDADGTSLPPDWYLRLAGEASKMLKKQVHLRSTIPIKPE